jgi:hypothetical protein
MASPMNVNSEHILTLSQLAKRLPRRRAGRPVHPATIHRWREPGVRNIRLECVRIGGIWHTSLEAYRRWVDRLTAWEQRGEDAPTSATPTPRRTAQDEAVERQLDDLGI